MRGPEYPTGEFPDPNHLSEDIYWNIDDRTGRVGSPEAGTYYAGWSKRLKKVVVLTLEGILLISPDTNTSEVAWKARGLLLSPWAVNDDLTKIIVTDYNLDKTSNFLTAIDLVSGAFNTREVPSIPSGLVFTNYTTAMVSVGEDLLKLQYDQSHGWRFEEIAGPHPEGAVTMVLNGKLVWVSWTDEKSKITYEDRTVELPGSFWHGIAHKEGMMVFTLNADDVSPGRSGNVYFIGSNYQVQEVAEIEGETIIGSGSSASGLWVATDDGVVRTFGRTEKTETIDLP